MIPPAGRIAIGSTLPRLHANAIKDPGFRIALYRPDSVVDGWEAGPFVVRGASVRGDAHRYYGVPRQDEMGLAWSPDAGMLVVAVADGVSGASLSHLGASVACRYAVEYFLRDGTDAREVDWRELLEGCAWAVVEAGQRVRSLSQPDPAQAEQDLATTLCVVVVTPVDTGATVRAVAVGDSGVAVVRGDQMLSLLGGKGHAVAGITDTAVVPLPRVPAEPSTGEWALTADETLLVGTDGIWDPVGDGNGAVAQFLVGALGTCLPDRTDFLRVVDFYRDTHDDDRTLIAVRLAAPAAEVTEAQSSQV